MQLESNSLFGGLQSNCLPSNPKILILDSFVRKTKPHLLFVHAKYLRQNSFFFNKGTLLVDLENKHPSTKHPLINVIFNFNF